MRIDQYLSETCLVKTRTIAKKACDQDLVKINGKPAKAHTEIKLEDIVEFHLYHMLSKVRVVKIPVGNVPKKTAGQYYEMLGRIQLEGSED